MQVIRAYMDVLVEGGNAAAIDSHAMNMIITAPDTACLPKVIGIIQWHMGQKVKGPHFKGAPAIRFAHQEKTQ